MSNYLGIITLLLFSSDIILIGAFFEANSVDPDEMPRHAAFPLSMHSNGLRKGANYG